MRARQLKPGFFKNEDLARCTPWARLMYAGLWTLGDREGRLEDRPLHIKGELFPFDDVDPEALLVELATATDHVGQPAFILRYEVNGGKYIQIIHFTKHQNPHVKEGPSTIPAPCKPGASTRRARGKHRASPGNSGTSRAPSLVVQVPDSMGVQLPPSPNPGPGASTGQDEPELPPEDGEGDEDFEAWFSQYLRKEKREDARPAWNELTPEERQEALATVKAWSTWKRRTTESRFWPFPENWLRKKRFHDEIPPDPESLCHRCFKAPRGETLYCQPCLEAMGIGEQPTDDPIDAQKPPEPGEQEVPHA